MDVVIEVTIHRTERNVSSTISITQYNCRRRQRPLMKKKICSLAPVYITVDMTPLL